MAQLLAVVRLVTGNEKYQVLLVLNNLVILSTPERKEVPTVQSVEENQCPSDPPECVTVQCVNITPGGQGLFTVLGNEVCQSD